MEEFDFEIRNPKWARLVSYIGCVLACAASVALGVLTGLGVIEPSETGWGFFGLVTGFFVLSLVCSYVSLKERFIFHNGVFLYVKPFRKAQSVNVKEISRVELHFGHGRIFKVVVFDKFEQVAMSFLDDGTSFKNGKFLSALEAYHIPVNR